MPLYTSPFSPTEVVQGDKYTLFDGTETPASGTKSAAINIGVGYGKKPQVIVFTTQFGTSPTAEVDIQAANENVEASYQTIFTGGGLQQEFYADQGGFAFYRANLSSYASGGMPKVIVQC